jgi:hypothetical protein
MLTFFAPKSSNFLTYASLAGNDAGDRHAAHHSGQYRPIRTVARNRVGFGKKADDRAIAPGRKRESGKFIKHEMLEISKAARQGKTLRRVLSEFALSVRSLRFCTKTDEVSSGEGSFQRIYLIQVKHGMRHYLIDRASCTGSFRVPRGLAVDGAGGLKRAHSRPRSGHRAI